MRCDTKLCKCCLQRNTDNPPTLDGADEAGHLFLCLGGKREQSVGKLGAAGEGLAALLALVRLHRYHQRVEGGVVHLRRRENEQK